LHSYSLVENFQTVDQESIMSFERALKWPEFLFDQKRGRLKWVWHLCSQ